MSTGQDESAIAGRIARMAESAARLLQLLSLLTSRPQWTAVELAGRLEVTDRTLRRDIERLRVLGYPVHSARGVAGGYRLGAGSALPPLLLDDEEATAIVIALRTAAIGGVTGIAETAVSALAKLERVLPARLRHRVASLQQATVLLPRAAAMADPQTLALLAAACASGAAADEVAYQIGDGYRQGAEGELAQARPQHWPTGQPADRHAADGQRDRGQRECQCQ
jgi:predicted DNA-binding transcriptional regulator YafY